MKKKLKTIAVQGFGFVGAVNSVNVAVSNHLKDYQVLYNQGEWQTHEHFHLKIKVNENIIKRMRADHFNHKKMEKRYNAV